MARKIKPARRLSEKLVAGARGHVLDAYDQATTLLTERERLDLTVTLREDLDLRVFDLTVEVRRRKRAQGAVS
jgi:hypothetical protein